MNIILQLKIKLKDFRPACSRTIAIRWDNTFNDLHDIIQSLFGLEDYHMRHFAVLKLSRNEYDPDIKIVSKQQHDLEDDDFYDGETLIADKTTLESYFTVPKIKIHYEYDYGDGRWFGIECQKILDISQIIKPDELPLLVKTQGAMLLEDCGGAWWLEELIKIYHNKNRFKAENYGRDDREEFEEYIQQAITPFAPQLNQ